MKYTRSKFGRLAFQSLQADARIYVSASEDALQVYHAALATEKGLPTSTCTGQALAWQTFLTLAAYSRLVGHAKMVLRNQGSSDFAFVLVNISQNSDWIFPSNSLAPALLRNSDFWVLAPDLAARALHQRRRRSRGQIGSRLGGIISEPVCETIQLRPLEARIGVGCCISLMVHLATIARMVRWSVSSARNAWAHYVLAKRMVRRGFRR